MSKNCKECGHQMDDNVQTCPNCGRPAENVEIKNRANVFNLPKVLMIVLCVYAILHIIHDIIRIYVFYHYEGFNIIETILLLATHVLILISAVLYNKHKNAYYGMVVGFCVIAIMTISNMFYMMSYSSDSNEVTEDGIDNTTGASVQTEEVTQNNNVEKKEAEQSPNTWNYSKDVDDLSGEVKGIRAYLVSENEIEYETGKTTLLAIGVNYSSITGILRNMVTITFVGDDYEDCQLSDFQGSGFLATFDDGPIDDTWKLVTMNSDRTSLSFHLSDEVDSFLSKLKQSRTCKIQVNLEHVGKKTFVFHCEGFKWDYQ